MNFKRQTKQISDAVDTVVATHANMFYSRIVEAWPVDTGYSKGAWQSPVQTKKGEWTIRNNVKYSVVLWMGRKPINGKMYGSNQLYHGGKPILDDVIYKMNRKLERL